MAYLINEFQLYERVYGATYSTNRPRGISLYGLYVPIYDCSLVSERFPLFNQGQEDSRFDSSNCQRKHAVLALRFHATLLQTLAIPLQADAVANLPVDRKQCWYYNNAST